MNKTSTEREVHWYTYTDEFANVATIMSLIIGIPTLIAGGVIRGDCSFLITFGGVFTGTGLIFGAAICFSARDGLKRHSTFRPE